VLRRTGDGQDLLVEERPVALDGREEGGFDRLAETRGEELLSGRLHVGCGAVAGFQTPRLSIGVALIRMSWSRVFWTAARTATFLAALPP